MSPVILQLVIFMSSAAGFYFFMTKLGIEWEVFQGICALLLGGLFVASRSFRCISFLSLPTVAIKTSRSIMRVIIWTFILTGPVSNFLRNWKEGFRVISCSAEIFNNQTLQRLQFLSIPYQNLTEEMFENPDDEKLIHDLNHSIEPVQSEVTGVTDDHQKYKEDLEKEEVDYNKKLNRRCEDIFNDAVDLCVEENKKFKAQCGFIGIASDKVCDSNKAGNPDLKVNYTKAKNATEDFKRQFDFKIEYEVVDHGTEYDNSLDTAEILMKINNDFLNNFRHLVYFPKNAIITIMKILIFWSIVWSAFQYRHDYLNVIDHDNTIVLPKIGIITIFKLFMEGILLFSFMAIDRLVAHFLDIVRSESYVEFHQQGFNEADVTIDGDGIVSNLVRSILHEFSYNVKLDTSGNNSECLPSPSYTDWPTIIMISLLFGLIAFIPCIQSRCVRLQRFIVATYYPEREEERARRGIEDQRIEYEDESDDESR